MDFSDIFLVVIHRSAGLCGQMRICNRFASTHVSMQWQGCVFSLSQKEDTDGCRLLSPGRPQCIPSGSFSLSSFPAIPVWLLCSSLQSKHHLGTLLYQAHVLRHKIKCMCWKFLAGRKMRTVSLILEMKALHFERKNNDFETTQKSWLHPGVT